MSGDFLFYAAIALCFGLVFSIMLAIGRSIKHKSEDAAAFPIAAGAFCLLMGTLEFKLVHGAVTDGPSQLIDAGMVAEAGQVQQLINEGRIFHAAEEMLSWGDSHLLSKQERLNLLLLGNLVKDPVAKGKIVEIAQKPLVREIDRDKVLDIMLNLRSDQLNVSGDALVWILGSVAKR